VHHLNGDSLSHLVDKVYEYASKLASARWRAKKTEYAVQVENSWKTKEGRLPFAMLREKPLPPVTDLRVCLDVKFAPQRWSPVGKAWIQVVNVNDYSIGDILKDEDFEVRVNHIRGQYIQFNRMLSRRPVFHPQMIQEFCLIQIRSLPKTNISSLKIGLLRQKERTIFQPSIFWGLWRLC